jgi:hypothetical protein
VRLFLDSSVMIAAAASAEGPHELCFASHRSAIGSY